MTPSELGGVERIPSSSALRHFRASPSLTVARWRSASAEALMGRAPNPRWQSLMARSSSRTRSSGVMGWSWKIWDRETRGELR